MDNQEIKNQLRKLAQNCASWSEFIDDATNDSRLADLPTERLVEVAETVWSELRLPREQ